MKCKNKTKMKAFSLLIVVLLVLKLPVCSFGETVPAERQPSPIKALFDHYHYTTADSWGDWYMDNYPGDVTIGYLTGPLTYDELKDYDIFVTYLSWKPDLGPRPTASEVEALELFVRNGGGVLLMGDDLYWGGWDNEYCNILSEPYNVSFNNDQLLDPTNYDISVTRPEDDYERHIVFHNMAEHPVTDGVSNFWVHGTCSFVVNNPDAVEIVMGDDDTYSDRYAGYPKDSYPPALVALEHGSGRIIFSGDCSGLKHDVYDNWALLWNIFDWIAGNGAEHDECQRMLDLLNILCDFYDHYLSDCNDCNPGTDPIKTDINDVDTEDVPMDERDIWMDTYPWYLNFGANLGIDANAWYDPSERSHLDIEVSNFLDSIALIDEDMLDFLQKFFFTFNFGGSYPRSPVYWNDGEERAEISVVMPINLKAGTLDVNSVTRGTWYYDEEIDQLRKGPLEDVVGGGSFGKNLLQKRGTFDLYIEELGYTIGDIGYQLTVAPTASFYFGLDTPDTLSLSLDALWFELSVDPNVGAIATGDINIPCVKLHDIDIEIEPEGEFLFEAIMPFKDYGSGEYIETEFAGHRYGSLQKFCPEGVVSLSDIEFNLRVHAIVDMCLLGTHTIDTVLGPYTWDIGFEEFWSIDIISRNSPVDIHIYDSEGRHAGLSDGLIENEIPNVFYYEEGGEQYIQTFSSVDEFTIEIEGTDTGKYGLELKWPIMLHDNTGVIIESINWKVEGVTTFLGDKDFFHFDFRAIQEQVQDRINEGKSVDESISEILESLDADEDGIPDIQDSNMVYTKTFTSLFVKDIELSPGESIFFEARLLGQKQPLSAKGIAFYLDGIFVGNALTDPNGIAQLRYETPDDFAEGTHELTATAQQDLVYAGCTGTALLKCVSYPPQVSLISPDNSLPLKGMVEINGTVSDTNLSSVRLLIDENRVSEELPYYWDTTGYPDGPHAIVLEATDATNKQTRAHMLVIVDNTLPVISNVSCTTSAHSAVIGWETNELCNSTVFLTKDLVNWVESAQHESVTHHRVLAGDLTPGVYFFKVQSKDWNSNKAQDNNGGTFYRFVIEADSGESHSTYQEYGPLANNNITEAESLKEKAYSLLREAVERGLDVSEAHALILEADEFLVKAEEFFSAGNFIAANNMALKAISLYQKAIEVLEQIM